MTPRFKALFQIACAGWTGIAFALVLTLMGCGTVSPKAPKSSQASFDANGQTSGFVGWTNRPQAHCGIFTASAVARYNALTVKWGSDARFVPPIKAWDGIVLELDGKTSTNYILSPAAIVNFMELSDVQRGSP